MRYIILFALWIVVICIGHINNASLLSGNAEMLGEYIGAVLIAPILFPMIISGIICAIAKKRNHASFIRGCCWVMGVILLSNIGNFLRLITPRTYTFNDTGISVSVPGGNWRTHTNKTNHLTMLITQDGNAVIYVQPIPPAENTSDLLYEINFRQQLRFIAQYNEEAFQFHNCDVNSYTCHYQDILMTIEKKKKRMISVILQNESNPVMIIGMVDAESVDKYLEQTMAMMFSAKNTKK